MFMITRRSMVVSLAATTILTQTPTALASAAHGIDDAADAKRKINIAGRQRMLTQRMAKASCFAFLDIERQQHIEQAKAAHALFDRSLRGLRYGDPELGLKTERNSRVQKGLGVVNGLWFSYGEAVANAFGGAKVEREALDAIIAQNLTILKEMNRTVGLTEQAYGGNEIPLHLAIAINIAGRQRMLTQKMSKEVCMIAAGYAPEETRGALAKTVALFDNSLLALREGMALVGIQPPKTREVAQQLSAVAEMWGVLKPVMDRVVADGKVEDTTLEKVATENNPLLVEMNKAVFLYEKES
ncbi:MAG: type IV pili methyl-accepting chemotaxis transducer N-terminal domain-containing protein [Pseudomonadota bacterium]